MLGTANPEDTARGAEGAADPSIFEGDAGPAHQRRRDRGRGCRPCAARCAEVPGVELAVIAPDGNRSRHRPLDHDPPAALGRGGRLRRRQRRLRHRRHAGGLRALRHARAGRRLRARPRRLRDQPRLQPRRRHHLLRHRGRRARGDRPRRCRRSPSRSSHARGSSTSASAASSTSPPRATFRARVVEELEEVPMPTATLLNINVPGRDPDGVDITRLGKRIYRDSLAPRRRARRPPPVLHLRRRRPATTTRRAPTSPPSPTAGSR